MYLCDTYVDTLLLMKGELILNNVICYYLLTARQCIVSILSTQHS